MQIARIALAFGRIERATRHEDGRRPETDSDHACMLGLLACEIAPRGLDRGLVAAYALVHNLPEVYAGDEQTLVISPAAAEAKRAREADALRRLGGELGRGSWLADLMGSYELQRVPEARFVRLVDKVLPKLTHLLNGCAAALPLTDRAGFVASQAAQLRQYEEEYPEFPGALALLRAAMLHAEACWPREPPAPDGPPCVVCFGPTPPGSGGGLPAPLPPHALVTCSDGCAAALAADEAAVEAEYRRREGCHGDSGACSAACSVR